MTNARDWIRELRPSHWVKNVFVLSPLVFSGGLTSWQSALLAIVAFGSFCALSSSVYVWNDIADRKRDRQHPAKRDRPIAAGRIGIPGAVVVGTILGVVGLGAAAALNTRFALVALAYLVNNLFYTLWLKEKVVADVLSIAIGFMLRLVGGAFAIDVEVSRWLLVCGFSLSLFLGFGKRRTELEQFGEESSFARPVMESYSKSKLDSSLAISCSLSILSYLLFVTDAETIARHSSNGLVYTLPVVVYALVRYMFKVQEGDGMDPVEILLHDRAFVLAGIIWSALAVLSLYAPGS